MFVVEPLIPMSLWRNVSARPEQNLYAEVVFDAVRLVRGENFAHIVATTKPAEVAAARAWIEDGNIGVVSFNEACGWLGWEPSTVRRAIFSAERWSAPTAA